MTEDKANLFRKLGTGVAIGSTVILAIILGVIFLSGNMLVQSPTCENGYVLDDRGKECIAKRRKVNDGIEEVGDGTGATNYSVSRGDKVVFNISHDTLEYLKVGQIFGDLKLDDRWIYVDPETQYFEVATDVEMARFKAEKKACLSADEAWENIGKDTCVAFWPGMYAHSGDILYIDEKQDYKNGFVAVFFGGFMSYDELLSEYYDKGEVAVYGTIERYEGHPQIKVYNRRQVTNPTFFAYSTRNNGEFVYSMNY